MKQKLPSCSLRQATQRLWRSIALALVFLSAIPLQAQVDESKYITLTTAKAVGETIRLTIAAEGDVRIEGVQEAYQPGASLAEVPKPYTLTSQEVKIYGDVQELDFYDAALTTLNLRQVPNLRGLSVNRGLLEQLDVSQCPRLEYLNLARLNLTSLDVSQNLELQRLYCTRTQLTSLDIRNNTKLEVLLCWDNDLRTLNVGHNVKLRHLYCSHNRLETLDISQLTNLTELDCSYNGIHELNLEGNLLRNLYRINISRNRIGLQTMERIVRVLPPIDEMSVPDYVRDRYALFIAVDRASSLESNRLSREVARIAKDKGWKVRNYNDRKDEQGGDSPYGIPYEGEAQVDESKYITMTTAKAVGETIKLTIVAEGDVRIEGVQEAYQPGASSVAEFPKPYTLTSQEVKIYGDVRKLRLEENDVTALDVRQMPTLEALWAGGNRIEELDVSQNPSLKNLAVSSNRLTQLDVRHNALLRELLCFDNRLTSLDVGRNVELRVLTCGENRLTHLDVSNNTQLENLECSSNQLKELDLRGLTKLEAIYCDNNQIETLDLEEKPNLGRIFIYSNRIGAEQMDRICRGIAPVDLTKYPEYFRASYGYFYAVDRANPNEGNSLRSAAARIAKEKGWKVRDNNGGRDAQGRGDWRGIPYDGEAQVDESKYITMTTAKAVGETIRLTIVAEGDVRIEGVQEAYQPGASSVAEVPKPYTLTSQEVKIYGDVRKLRLEENDVTALDVRQMPTLEALWAGFNRIEELDVSQNPSLKNLDVSVNRLTQLDVRHNALLRELLCFDNRLTSLDVRRNVELRVLTCGGNRLTHLDVSNNTQLLFLYCDGNQLKELDLRGLTKLAMFGCSDNQIEELDLEEKPRLSKVIIHSNRIGAEQMERICRAIPAIDLSRYLENSRAWNGLFIAVDRANSNEGNRLSREAARIAKEKGWKVRDKNSGRDDQGRVDWRGIPYEGEAQVDESKYITLTTAKAVGETIKFEVKSEEDVRFEGLEIIEEDGVAKTCRLTSQTIRIVGAVNRIYLERNRLTSIDVSQNPVLERLDLEDNELTNLDVRNNPLLDHLNCNNNRLTSLDVTKNVWLVELDCDDNQLTTLDVSQNVVLRELDCRRNQIGALDVSKNKELRQLHCSNNKIKHLDLSGSGKLHRVDCSHNELESLTITPALRATGATSLAYLDCSHNRLMQLDLSAAKELRELSVQVNRFGREAMQAIVDALPKQEGTRFVAVDKTNPNERNHIERNAVAEAKGKGWSVRDANDDKNEAGEPSEDGIPYEGEEKSALETLASVSLSLYPNPATSYIIVDGAEVGQSVGIYSLTGALVREELISEGRQRIELRGLERGVYLVRIEAKALRLVVE